MRVPASSANLGPGYDVLAVALSLSLELEVEETGRFSVECEVPGVPLDRTNLCVRSFEALAPADGITFRIRSEIPPSAGLGSSAAAIVAGLVAADHMYELAADIVTEATRIEGHPDNVGAAARGGFVICTDGGRVDRLDVRGGLEGLLAIPPDPVPTAMARAAMPAEVPIADAVHNAAHTALLAVGLTRGDLDLVARGLADRLHQPRREHLYPRSMELVRRAPDLGAVGASISGAGPTVLFWSQWEATGGLFEALRREAPDCVVRRVQFVPAGADVEEL